MQYREYITQKVFIKVYEDGTIKGTVKGNPVKKFEDEGGYLRVNVSWCHGRIHQIVYCLFNNLDGVPEGYEIHHIDKKKQNNSLDNLQLLTHKQHREIHYDDIFTEENRQKLSDNMKGENNPMKNADTAAKVADKLKGRPAIPKTEEGKKKLSDKMKGENNPMKNPETVKKMLETRGEFHLSDETKQKISDAMTGRQHTEESKLKMSEAHSGEGNPAYGRRWMNNKYYKIYAKPEWIEKLIEKGFEFGYKKTLPKYDLSNII